MEVYNSELFGAVCSSVPSQGQKQFAHDEQSREVKEVMRNLEKEHHAKIARRIAKEEHKAAERQKAEAQLQENYKREVENAVWNEFKKRNDAFFIRHADMFEATLPIIERTMWNDACARREVYNKWHEEVYKPIQYQIDKAVERKCNSTTRPHIYQTIKDKWNVPHYCCNINSTIGRGGYEENEKFADQIHALQDKEFYFTSTINSEDNNNKCNEEGYNTHSLKLHLESGDYANIHNVMMQSNASPMIAKATYNNNINVKSIKPHKLTWKEQKDELWQSFLRESNRKSCYGGRHGIFLDVIDEISYDPLRQCHEDTIYYHVPTRHGSNSSSINSCNALCSMNKNKEKLKRRAIADMYNKLALAYRTEEDKSITGVLKHTYHVPTSATTQTSASAYTNNNYRIQTIDDDNQNTQSKNQRSRLHPPVYVENEYVHLPHVFIPFDYGAYRGEDNNNTNDDSTDKDNNRKKYGEYSEHECIMEVNNTNNDRVNNTNGMSNELIDKESRRANDMCKKEIVNPLMPFNTFRNKHSYHSAATMPSNTLSFLPHVTLPTTMYARRDNNNSNRDLTVCQWGERELANTRYGRYVSTRGDVLPLCARKQKYALQASKSNVHFDHFNYPRGNDNE